MVYSLIGIVQLLLTILIYIIVAQAILSWLVAFNVINTTNDFVRQILYALDRLTEPMLRPIRRIMPDLGGIDFSSMVLILILVIIQRLLGGLAYEMAVG